MLYSHYPIEMVLGSTCAEKLTTHEQRWNVAKMRNAYADLKKASNQLINYAKQKNLNSAYTIENYKDDLVSYLTYHGTHKTEVEKYFFGRQLKSVSDEGHSENNLNGRVMWKSKD